MSHSLQGSFTIYYRTQTEAQTLVSAGRTLRPPISGAHDRMRQLAQKSQLEQTQLKRNVRQLTRSIELCWRWVGGFSALAHHNSCASFGPDLWSGPAARGLILKLVRSDTEIAPLISYH